MEKRDMGYKIATKKVMDICIAASSAIHLERKKLREQVHKLPSWNIYAIYKADVKAIHYGEKELSFCTTHIKAIGISTGTYCYLSPKEMEMLYNLYRDYLMDLKN